MKYCDDRLRGNGRAQPFGGQVGAVNEGIQRGRVTVVQGDDGLGAGLGDVQGWLPKASQTTGATRRTRAELDDPLAADSQRRGDASAGFEDAQQAEHGHSYHQYVGRHQIVFKNVSDFTILPPQVQRGKDGSTKTQVSRETKPLLNYRISYGVEQRVAGDPGLPPVQGGPGFEA